MSDDGDVAKMELGFKALGSAHRIQIVRILSREPDGLTVGALQAHLDIPWSTLSHHITVLTRAGIVSQERRGREVCCTLDHPCVAILSAEMATWLEGTAPAVS